MNSSNSILAGDVGGTHTRLALARIDGSNIHIENFKMFRGDDYSALEDIITAYLAQCESLCEFRPDAASLAIAGPIHEGQVRLTNRDWHVSGNALADQFGFNSIKLHNDFAAMSRSILIMGGDSFEVFYKSDHADPLAPILVAGPGTGFGVGIVLPGSTSPRVLPRVLPSEGGHIAYAPLTDTECEVLKYLSRKHDFVSLELVCAGNGLDAVHEAICALHNVPYHLSSPANIQQRAEAGDPVCQDVCEIRAAAVMGAVGDMALTCGALGGVVLAGGVSEGLSNYLRAPKAMARFFNRGPRNDYMKRISIRLLTNPEAPLYGAAALYQDHV